MVGRRCYFLAPLRTDRPAWVVCVGMSGTKIIDLVLTQVEIISFAGQHVVALTVNGKIISHSKPFTDIAAAEAFAKAVISGSVESGGPLKPGQPRWN
jgi:hypothetical protein